MKTALLLTALLSATSANALILKGETSLDEWNTTSAGRALLKQSTVHASADVQLQADLAVQYKGYAANEVCDLFGESPNGEPEFAPCLKSHMTYAPKFEVSAPAKLVVALEDLQSSSAAVLSADLTGCIENYESLVVLAKPSAAPAQVVLKSQCDLYFASSPATVSGRSAKLAGANVKATAQVMLEGSLKTSRVLTIENGRASADVASEIAGVAATLKGSPLYSRVEAEASVLDRAGKAVELFNYALRVEMQ